MTLREARSVARRFRDVNSTVTPGQLYYACTTLLRALSRPTRLEREAEELMQRRASGMIFCCRTTYHEDEWLARYERKRKGKR
jgi:hypothetical protein